MFKYLHHGLAAIASLAACMTGELYAQVVLSIDRDTGAATIRNDSDSAQVNFDGYTIQSENGLLDSVGWSSFVDQLIAGWVEAPTSSSTGLAEFNSTVGGFATLTLLWLLLQRLPHMDTLAPRQRLARPPLRSAAAQN